MAPARPPNAPRQRRPPDCGVFSYASAANWIDPFGSDGHRLTIILPPEADSPAGLAILGSVSRSIAPAAAGGLVHLYGVPVTTPARTVLDLMEDYDEDETSMGRMLNGMIRASVVDLEALPRQLDDMPTGKATATDHGCWRCCVMPRVRATAGGTATMPIVTKSVRK